MGMTVGGYDGSQQPFLCPLRRLRTLRLRNWVSPLTSRLMMVNFLPLLFMGGMLLSINAVRNTLLAESVEALREQARIYASVLQQAQRVEPGKERISLDTAQAHVLLEDMIRFSRNAQVRLYAPNGSVLTESRKGDFEVGGARWQPNINVADRVYGWVLAMIPLRTREGLVPLDNSTISQDFGHETDEDVHMSPQDELPPYIRLTAEHELVMTVVEPVVVKGKTLGVLQLTRYNADIDRAIIKVRWVIIIMLLLGMGAAVLLSWYFALTLARPLRRLVERSREMREPGKGRVDGLPYSLLSRRDEIGELARTLRESALALWARMDDVERFAAEVSHELKNPLSSIRSALDTLPRITDSQARDRLLCILGGDVKRLERLIADISLASRVEGELQRGEREAVDVIALLGLFVEVNEATRQERTVDLVLSTPEGDDALCVFVVRDRLVQVLHNLIGNATSFSPAGGTIGLKVRPIQGPPQLQEDGTIMPGGPAIEIAVEDEGPGVPPARLDSIFDRFYSERPAGEHFGQHSGLGLAISRQIITAFEGTLHAENREEFDPQTGEKRICGARFVIRLPRFMPC
ncbi:HAMP domain-containing histidine kinase [Bombella sp. TMW 2.2543]|uniref:histidine kinase n=1 Tax=Bombella pluederhausensis TaxID=2967336 RepID=A0ABT3WJI5_9PROT|nr:HAMP domain-containing sensor histidine kinase [Bombella pluederhausensis]MCX5617984.1 HAMP domain-containing histidine kinase [Bombella pluederhausensis]